MDFPYLWAKPSGGDGKRTKGKKCCSNVAPGPPPRFIVKTLDDPKKVLGKRRQARILSECWDNFTPDVQYSIDKKNRWLQVNTEDLLENVDTDEVAAQVVVLRTPPPVCYYRERKVTELHEVSNDGEVVSKTAKGHGVHLGSITKPVGEKKRGSRARREIAARLAAEEEERNNVVKKDEPEKAKIRYTVIHDQPFYYGRYIRGKSSPKTRRARVKCVDVSELEQSELEQSVYIEDDGYKPSRDLRFCLGDYITEKAQTAVHVRRESLEIPKHPFDLEKLDFPELEAAKPFELADLSSVLRKPSAFEFAYVDLHSWTDFNFVDQVEALRDEYAVRWLDVINQRVLIDATGALHGIKDYTGEPAVMLIIESCWRKRRPFLKVFLNTTVAPDEWFTWRKFKSSLAKGDVCNVRNVVESTLQFPKSWSTRTEPVNETVMLYQRKEYRPVFNAMGFVCPSHQITYEHMATLLREKCERLGGESFEKISQDDLESELEEVACNAATTGNDTATTGAKCVDCGTDQWSNLYEMDDCWMCRSCLKQQAVHQIRVKSFPINLPLVVPDGVTSYDVLPSIIPLALFNFYTKLAAVTLIEQSLNGAIGLSECPGCKETVDLVRPNEYNCVLCECGLVWCTGCKREPHWPMLCQAAAEWARRWKHHGLRAEDQTRQLREITCSCLGPPIVVTGSEQYAKCTNCNTVFDPNTMYILSRNGHPSYGKYIAVEDKLLPNIHVPPIKKEVIQACEKARRYRFETAKLNELERACRKVGDVVRLDNLRDVRQTVLYVVEYGLAWINVEKSIADRSVIKINLFQLLRQYEELVATMDHRRYGIIESVESLNVAVQKVIELIKKNL